MRLMTCPERLERLAILSELELVWETVHRSQSKVAVLSIQAPDIHALQSVFYHVDSEPSLIRWT